MRGRVREWRVRKRGERRLETLSNGEVIHQLGQRSELVGTYYSSDFLYCCVRYMMAVGGEWVRET